jgi:hypothetical protein
MPTLDRSQLLDCRAALLDESAGLLRLAVDAQSDVQRLQRLALAQGMQLELVELTQASLEERLAELRVQEIGQVAEDSQALYDAHGGPEREGLAQGRLLLQLLAQGLRLRASDIHLQPAADCLELRLRIDGHLRTVERLPLSLHAGLVARSRWVRASRSPNGPAAGRPHGRHPARRARRTPACPSFPARAAKPCSSACHATGTSKHRRAGHGRRLRLPLLDMLRQASGLSWWADPPAARKTTTLHALMRHLALPGRKLLSVEDRWKASCGGQPDPRQQGGMGFRIHRARHAAPRPRRHHGRRDRDPETPAPAQRRL